MVTRRDQLASKAKKKEDEPRGGRGRGRAKSRGRGKGPGRGRGRGNRAEPATPEDECDDDEEMEGEDGEGCENGEKGEVDPVELGKVPKKLRPFVAPKPETSRAASSSKPRASRASSSRPKPSAKAKASSEPKTSRASSPKDKKEPKTSRASSSKAKKEPKAVSSSKAKKEPKTSRVSEDKGTVKACSEGDGGEPMESNKSKPKMKANKKRTISENGSSRPASRPRRSRSVPSRDWNLQKEIKEIQSFTEALDYHNLEFDDLKFYIKEAVTQQFEFKITQLNIYWKTARYGIRMYRADGKCTDPFSFTFPSDSGGHLLRMVVAVATAAHMVTSLYLHIENMFYVFVGWKVSVHPTDSCGPLCFKLVRSHHCLDLRPSASRMLGTWWNLMMTWTTWTDWPSTTGVLELKCFAVWVLLMLTKFQLLTYFLWGVSLCCHARHGASLGSAQCHHDCAMFVTTWAYIPNFLGATKFDVRSRVHLLIGSLGTVPMTFAIEFNFSYAFKMVSLSNINHVFSEPWLSQATQFLRPCHHPSVLGAAG